jgi:site-specific recombinase XerD
MFDRKAAAVAFEPRHTFASPVIHEGRSIPSVTASLGHSFATTTLTRYAH